MYRMTSGLDGVVATDGAFRWLDYLKVARPDHWFKNVFMLAGVAAALVYSHRQLSALLLAQVLLAIAATCCVASFNYIINEILDASHDQFHPTKRYRPIPSGRVRIFPLQLLAGAFLTAGLASAWLWFPRGFLLSLGSLALMGLVYNVRPLRTKDVPYLDAVSESVNNPIRLCIGWFAVGAAVWPPSSLLLAYWAIGAFLMTAKRYAEYRAIGDRTVAAQYRRSFAHYSEQSLLIAMIVYISCFMCMFGVLAAKYHTELLLGIPLLAMFVAWFFHLAFEPNSIIQEPERIVHRPAFVLYCVGLFAVIVALAVSDLGFLANWLGLPNVKW